MKQTYKITYKDIREPAKYVQAERIILGADFFVFETSAVFILIINSCLINTVEIQPDI